MMDDISVENNGKEDVHLVNNNNSTSDLSKNTLKRKNDDLSDE